MIKTRIQERGERCGFDAVGYFDELTRKNRLCQEKGFKSVLCSGPLSLEGIVSSMKTAKNYIAIDDRNEGTTFASDGGFFHRTTYTVFILAKYKFMDMEDHNEKLALCRRIYVQFLRRILKDKYNWEMDFTYLLNENVEYRELSSYFVEGLTGVEFHLTVQHPLDLEWDEGEWEE